MISVTWLLHNWKSVFLLLLYSTVDSLLPYKNCPAYVVYWLFCNMFVHFCILVNFNLQHMMASERSNYLLIFWQDAYIVTEFIVLLFVKWIPVNFTLINLIKLFNKSSPLCFKITFNVLVWGKIHAGKEHLQFSDSKYFWNFS